MKAQEIQKICLSPQLFQSGALWPCGRDRELGCWRFSSVDCSYLINDAGQPDNSIETSPEIDFDWRSVKKQLAHNFIFEMLNCTKSNQFDLLSLINQWMDERKIQFFVQSCTEFKRPHPILYNIFISLWCRLQLAGMRQGAGLLLLVMDCILYSAAKASESLFFILKL